MSRPAGGLRGAYKGYGAVPRSKKYVIKYFHWFFITINSMILYFKHIIHIDDSPSTGTCLGYKGILTDSHLLIDDQEKGFVNVKHVTVVKCKCHGMHTCTPQLFDKNLTVHNRLHSTKNMYDAYSVSCICMVSRYC